MRRATLDLIGLPPTPEEIEAFEKDDCAGRVREGRRSPARVAALRRDAGAGSGSTSRATARTTIARSIRSGRGYNPYPNAYLYRDWVIKAFNDDLPYDQFVRAQLAADLLGDRRRARATLPALGFLGLGPWFYDNGAVEITRADERHDRVDVVSRGFLGLTVGCARCHDHKYDPIPTRGLLLAGRRVPQHRVPRVSAGRRRASSTSTTRRTSRSRRRKSCSTSSCATEIDAAGRDAGAAGVEVHDRRRGR